MGRKIPGRKHRGVIDPIKQLKRREERLKSVVNSPPTTLDQPIPKSMLEFARLKEIGKKSQFNSSGKKKKKAPDGAFVRQVYAEDKGKKGNPKLRVMKKKNRLEDTDRNRTSQFHKERQQAQLYEDSDDEIIDKTHGKMSWKDGTERKKKNLPGVEPKKKVDRRIERRKKLLEKKHEKMKEKEQLVKKDIIAFGEVVHEPPSMRVKPKYAAANERQMGLKDLHLKRILSQGSAAPVGLVSAASTAKPKVRLRDLPARERCEAERKQQDAIAAYKLLKAKKYSGTVQR